jgi:hypothetical protein
LIANIGKGLGRDLTAEIAVDTGAVDKKITIDVAGNSQFL